MKIGICLPETGHLFIPNNCCRLCRLLLEHPKATITEKILKNVGELVADTVVEGDSTTDDLELAGEAAPPCFDSSLSRTQFTAADRNALFVFSTSETQII